MESSNEQLKEINPSSNLVVTNAFTETRQPSNEESTINKNLESTATVKVLLMPLGQIVTLAYPLKTTINDIVAQFSENLKLASEHLVLTHSATKSILSANMCLSDLGVETNGLVQLELTSIDPHKYPINTYKPTEYIFSPDVITVRVDMEENKFKEVIVEIERPANAQKPYLGGYKHKKTGLQFLNASTQTRKPQRADNGIPKFCRDTQTVVSHHAKLQTRNDMSTQMTKIGVFVSVRDDKLLTPRPYETAEELLSKQTEKAIIIQKYYRRWLAKRQFEAIKEAYIERAEWEREQEMQRVSEIEARRQADIQRRLNPRTKGDFEILYAALEKWRLEEMAKINGSKTGAARKAALALLLDQETELIATIERYKIEANKENKEKNIQTFLERVSAPKRWKYKDGTTIEVDSPYNIRAKELKDIYNSLNMKYLTQDERLDVLLTLKHTVKEHDCKLTQEIIELIDREADLLMRGIKEENLTGLRKRISTLYLQYIKTPQFNPAVTKHLKVPIDINDTTKENYYCSTCEKYLPSIEFQVSATNVRMGKCKKCKNLENIAIKRTDFTKFKHMLIKIQNDEEFYGQESRVCYLLTDQDIKYVFESIWNSQSVLSNVNDVYQLHFVRWNKLEEWSPWNSILLTLEEAVAHLKLTNLEANYGEPFMRKIKQKHIIAKNYFAKLPGVAEHMRKLELKGDLTFPTLSGIKIV